MNSIYDYPEVYEAVQQRPASVIDTESASLRRLLSRYHIEDGRILEVCCGACPNGIRLAQLGYEVVGVDLSRPLLDEAARKAESAGVLLELHHADVRDLRLQTKPCDAAIWMFETFAILCDYDELVRHFQSVHRILKPGGVYIIDSELPHPRCGNPGQINPSKSVQLPDGRVEHWLEDLPYDPVRAVSGFVLHCRVERAGVAFETRDEYHVRHDSPWHLERLVQTLEGWKLEGFYRWQDLDTDIQEASTYWMVLRRI